MYSRQNGALVMKIKIIFFTILTILCSSNSFAVSGEAIVNASKLIKNSFTKVAKEAEEIGQKGLTELPKSKAIKPPASSLENSAIKSSQSDAIAASSWWTTQEGQYVSSRLAICAGNKVVNGKKVSQDQSTSYCRTAFLQCREERKNNFGFQDSQCITDVNSGKFVARSNGDLLTRETMSVNKPLEPYSLTPNKK